MWEEPLSRTLTETFQLFHKVYQRVSGKYKTISLFAKRYHISLTMKVQQVHHPRKHMTYMYIILIFVNNSQ